MKELHIMRGLPGSGKSTVAEGIREAADNGGVTCRLCSTDNFHMVNGKYVFQPDKLKEYHIKNQADCEVYMAAGIERIIIDNTNTTLREMEPYVRLAKQYGYTVIISEANTPWAFNVDECAKRNTHGVPKEAIERMKARYEDTSAVAFQILQQFGAIAKIDFQWR